MLLGIPLVTLATLLVSSSVTIAMPVPALSLRSLDVEQEPELFARDGHNCWKVNINGAKRLSAWKKIEAYANQHWGGGDIHANTGEYADKTLLACVDMGKVESSWKGEPKCNNAELDAQGATKGVGDVFVLLKQEVGHEAKTSWSVTKSSEFSAGASFSVGIGSPLTGRAEASFSVSTTLKDEATSSGEATDKSWTSTQLGFTHKDGKICSAKIKTTTCVGELSASVKVKLKGSLQVKFGSRVPDRTIPGSTSHFHWFIQIEDVLNDQERTTVIELSVSANTKSATKYDAECKPDPKRQNAERAVETIKNVASMFTPKTRAGSTVPDLNEQPTPGYTPSGPQSPYQRPVSGSPPGVPQGPYRQPVRSGNPPNNAQRMPQAPNARQSTRGPVARPQASSGRPSGGARRRT